MFPKIEPIKAFTDNYIWAIVTDSTVTVVDPGDPNAVEKYLNQNKLLLKNILITHHHYDHTGGITKLSENRNLKVYGPKGGHIEGITNQLTEGSKIQVEGISFEVFETPGHTLDHISYYSLEENILFCGDTLFSGGCGRLFEGTPQQMFTSLKKLSTLPSETKVFCTHEYTLSNLSFALEVEPENQKLLDYFNKVSKQRENDEISLPSSIDLENKINPFLRTKVDQIKLNAENYSNTRNLDEVEVFSAVRSWKDNY